MPVKVGTSGEEGSIIGGYNCIRDYLYRYFDARDRQSATGDDTTWNDISGNNTNFTFYQGDGAADHVNYYWDLDGSNDYMQMATLPFDEDTDFSIELWAFFRTDSLTGKGTVIMQGNTNHSFGFDRGETSGTVRFGIRFSSGTVYGVTSNSLSTDTWYHLAGTIEADDTVTLYVNGVSQGTSSITASTFSETGNVRIGPTRVLGGSGTTYWDGAISVLRIYNKTLSHDEVLYNFNADRGGFGI
jgi:hypothetical protein